MSEHTMKITSDGCDVVFCEVTVPQELSFSSPIDSIVGGLIGEQHVSRLKLVVDVVP